MENRDEIKRYPRLEHIDSKEVSKDDTTEDKSNENIVVSEKLDINANNVENRPQPTVQTNEQPPTNVDSIETIQEAVENLDSENSDPAQQNIKETKRDIVKLLAHGEKLALELLTQLLNSKGDKLTIDSLVNAINCLQDLRLSHEWTERLIRAIEKNPSLMKVPGLKGSDLLNKLTSRANKLKSVIRPDKRKGVNQDLPMDE